MRLKRVRNKIKQRLYRPGPAKPRFLSQRIMASLDEIDRAIEEKITPLLSGLHKQP